MERKVGDKILIREWDDMLKQFGLGAMGSINCQASFTQKMKYLCGKEVYISEINNHDTTKQTYYISLKKSLSRDEGYSISDDMIYQGDLLFNEMFNIPL